MKTSYYEAPKPGKVMKFFWAAAGADSYILERSTYSDHIKYACLGGIVVATGVMAGIAGGYAFYTIFEPKGSVLDSEVHWPTSILSMFFGVVWGLIIFNIDRFIVTSTGKGDGTEAITMQELKSAIPRILMGMIIAITISKPVEIRMFKSEIDAELHKAQMEKQREYLSEIESIYAGRMNTEKSRIEQWQQDILQKEEAYSHAVKVFNDELAEKPGGSSSGYGPDAKKKEAIMQDRKIELLAIRAKNEPLIAQGYENLTKIENEKQSEADRGAVVASKLDGLLERIKLAHEIAGFTISLFITLLFMAIELTPIFFKLMLVKSPYDYLEENYKELIKAEQGIQVVYDYYKDKQGMERNLVRYHQADQLLFDKETLTKAQKELSEVITKKWIEREKQKIKENLDDYIVVDERLSELNMTKEKGKN